MLNHGITKTTAFLSPLAECSTLAPTTERHRRSIVAELLLTALIDAFSILVIFLLMNFSSTGEIIFVAKGMELPKAEKAEVLLPAPVIKIDQAQLYLDEKPVTPESLLAALIDLKKAAARDHADQPVPDAITIQGDRRLKYQMLNSIVLASSEAGFSNIKFAVLGK
jgi:biopolymer transport protein ExbD